MPMTVFEIDPVTDRVCTHFVARPPESFDACHALALEWSGRWLLGFCVERGHVFRTPEGKRRGVLAHMFPPAVRT